jgi:hypothetical protein
MRQAAYVESSERACTYIASPPSDRLTTVPTLKSAVSEIDVRSTPMVGVVA